MILMFVIGFGLGAVFGAILTFIWAARKASNLVRRWF